MRKMENTFKAVFAAVMSVITYLFGRWDGLVTVLVTVIALDYISGVLPAAHA